MNTIACVFARGGSKGIPRKNLRHVAGRPLLAWAIEAAFKAETVSRVMVSTDDPEIMQVALDCGAGYIPRPPELATDDSPEWLSWQHAVRYIAAEPGRANKWDWLFVSVPCTAPLRLPADIDNAVRYLLEHPKMDVLLTVTPCHRNPWYNQVIRLPDGEIMLAAVGSSDIMRPDEVFSRRQDAPLVYDVTTVAYAARPQFLLSASGIWDGTVGVVEVPPERAIDIDTELDLRIADFLLREREKGDVAW